MHDFAIVVWIRGRCSVSITWSKTDDWTQTMSSVSTKYRVKFHGLFTNIPGPIVSFDLS